MTYETGPERLRADLADPLFTCYVYVGDEADKGWSIARFAHRFVTQLNIYLFEGHEHLREWVGQERPRGLVFDWGDTLVAKLNAADSRDLIKVMEAIADAKRLP